MQIHPHQVTALSQSLAQRTARAGVDALVQRYPVAARFTGRAEWEDITLASAAAAVRFGVSGDAGAGLSLHWTVALGSDFPDDPQFAWLRDLLERPLGLPPLLRMQVIEWNVWAYQDRAEGVHGEWAAAAWAQVAALQARHWDAMNADLTGGGQQWMAWLHPQRASFVTPAARSAVGQAARAAAQALGLPGMAPATLIAVLMFLFGSHVLDSPLHTWVRACLEAGGTADERCQRLAGRLAEYARAQIDHHRSTGASP